jgi:hypothetical protein
MWGEYDYLIPNEGFDAAHAELAHIYHAERPNRARNPWLKGFVRGCWTRSSRLAAWIVTRPTADD